MRSPRSLDEEKGLRMNYGTIFVSEVTGTAMLTLLGCGVVATAILVKSKGFGGGWLLINFGWAIAVFAGGTVAYASGAQLNPAVTLGMLVAGKISGGIGTALVSTLPQLLGAFIGPVLAWLAFKK